MGLGIGILGFRVAPSSCPEPGIMATYQQRLLDAACVILLLLCFVDDSNEQQRQNLQPMSEKLAKIIRPCMIPVGSGDLDAEAEAAINSRMLRCASMVRLV